MLVSGSNVADLLEAANVHKRKRTGNEEKKRRNVPWPIDIPERMEDPELPLIPWKTPQDERNVAQILEEMIEVEPLESCEFYSQAGWWRWKDK